VPVLNEADAIYLGIHPVDRMILDEVIVWPNEDVIEYGSDESLWPPAVSPQAPGDPQLLVLGSQFKVLADGRITAIRFWRHSGPQTSRVVALWSDAGDKLAEVVTSGEVDGWNVIPIGPIEVSANEVLRVSYGYTGSLGGAFAYTNTYVPGSAHLTWLQGCYLIGANDQFPVNLIVPNNYFADVVYQPVVATVPPFNPDTITGLRVWLDAVDYLPGSWLNKAGGGGQPVIKGAPAPAWATSTQNGLPVVRFKPNEGRLRMLSGSGVYKEWTLVYVGRMVGPTSGRIVNAVYQPANLLVGYWNGMQDVMYDGGFANPNLQTAWTSDWKMYGGDGSDTPSTHARLLSRGELLSTLGSGVEGWKDTFSISGFDPEGTQETCDCEVAEVCLYNRKLDDAERQQVETYLREKWSIT